MRRRGIPPGRERWRPSAVRAGCASSRRASTRLPFPDGAFDAVFFHQVLQHLSEPVAALAEARRVLAPGGVVGVRDSDWGSIIMWPSDPLVAQLRALFERWQRHNGGDQHLGRQLRRLLREAGFRRIASSASVAYVWLSDPTPRRSNLAESDFGRGVIALGWTDAAILERLAAAGPPWPRTRPLRGATRLRSRGLAGLTVGAGCSDVRQRAYRQSCLDGGAAMRWTTAVRSDRTARSRPAPHLALSAARSKRWADGPTSTWCPLTRLAASAVRRLRRPGAGRQPRWANRPRATQETLKRSRAPGASGTRPGCGAGWGGVGGTSVGVAACRVRKERCPSGGPQGRSTPRALGRARSEGWRRARARRRLGGRRRRAGCARRRPLPRGERRGRGPAAQVGEAPIGRQALRRRPPAVGARLGGGGRARGRAPWPDRGTTGAGMPTDEAVGTGGASASARATGARRAALLVRAPGSTQAGSPWRGC